METNSVTRIQLHQSQGNVRNSPNQGQFREKVFSLRKQISQIAANPQKMDNQRKRMIYCNLANLIGNHQRVQTLVNYLDRLRTQLANALEKRNSTTQQDKCSLKDKINSYLLKPIELSSASKAQKLWKYRQIYLQSEQLQKKLICSENVPKLSNKIKLGQILLINKVICCMQLQIYEKALSIVQMLNRTQFETNNKLLSYVQSMKKIILLKMGCRLNINPSKKENLYKRDKSNDSSQKMRLDNCLSFKIIALDKESLQSFIENIQNTTISISIRNLYNLALVCKKYQYFECSQAILSKILGSLVNENPNRLKSKCLVLLSEIEEEKGNFRQAIKVLKEIKLDDEIDRNQWYFRKIRLQKKCKIEEASKTCPMFSPRQAKKFNLLCGLQNQLNKLKAEKQITEVKTKKNVSKLYQISTRKKTVKKTKAIIEFVGLKSQDCSLKTTTKLSKRSSKIKHDSNLSTQLQTKAELLSQIKYQLQKQVNVQYQQIQAKTLHQEERKPKQIISEQKLSFQQNNEVMNTLTTQTKVKQQQAQADQRRALEVTQKQIRKEVKFEAEEETDQTVSQIIYKGEENIMSAIISQSFQQIISEIKSILEKLTQEMYCIKTQNFIVKCVNWYRMVGKFNQSASFLKLIITQTKDSKDAPKFQKHCLRLLGEVYQELKDSKNASLVYLQLANLGQIEYYDKLGQLELVKQHYLQSIKYFEIYNEFRQTLYAKSKLAHAYSKIPIFKKKAIDMLNQMLFQHKKLMIFKDFQLQEIPDAQNSVLLLASIYMNHPNGNERATYICQNFLRFNFSAYPIYYMLGVIQEQEGRKQEAFKRYLTTLKLKPNHLPSLIRIVNDIGIGNNSNFEILDILRKAFVQNNRDWQLLQLLVQSITLKKSQVLKPTVQQLIRIAKLLQKAEVNEGDMGLQIEMVWTWAFEVIEQRRLKEQVIEDQYQNQINMKLGQINMAKGNLKASQFYLKKVLGKLDLRRKRTQRRKGIIKFEKQVLQKLSFINCRQNYGQQANQHKNEALSPHKDYNIQKKWEAERKLDSLSPTFSPF